MAKANAFLAALLLAAPLWASAQAQTNSSDAGFAQELELARLKAGLLAQQAKAKKGFQKPADTRLCEEAVNRRLADSHFFAAVSVTPDHGQAVSQNVDFKFDGCSFEPEGGDGDDYTPDRNILRYVSSDGRFYLTVIRDKGGDYLQVSLGSEAQHWEVINDDGIRIKDIFQAPQSAALFCVTSSGPAIPPFRAAAQIWAKG